MSSDTAGAIKERAAKILAAHQIDPSDQTFLMSVFAGNNIDDASEALIDQIYEALAVGKVRIVD